MARGHDMPAPDEELRFYASHSVMTDPGPHARLLDGAPEDLGELARWVRNVVFHEAYAAEADLDLPHDSFANPPTSDPAVRFVETMLGRILSRDDRPLAAARPKEKCFIGTCRDYAVLLCALLRHQGRPARVRCGFEFYYAPGSGFGADHWVTEVWDGGEGRWHLVDAEVDPDLPQHRVVAVDPFDVPRDRFQPAGAAWRRYRAGRADTSDYGIFGEGPKGDWLIAGNVVRDLAALNKHELAPSDWWGMATKMCLSGEVTAAQAGLIDDLADLIADDPVDFAGLREAYEGHKEIRLSNPITGWPKGAETEFRLAAAHR